MRYIRQFDQLSIDDIALVGGKNASLGEMYRTLSNKGIKVPNGFATTADAYRHYIDHNQLHQRIKQLLNELDSSDVTALATTGARIRSWINHAEMPQDLAEEIDAAYQQLEAEYGEHTDVAVRSSATAEDLPSASFAGQQETYLNIRGSHNLIATCKHVFASLFTDRAISYRIHQGFNHMDVALSIGVQKMVRADLGASGVMFTIDTETGFRDVVFITAAYGLGENVVQGTVNPDEFYVYKPKLTEGKRPILKRQLGEKAIKMIYTRDPMAGHSTRNVRVKQEDRNRFALSDEEVLSLARLEFIINNSIRIHPHALLDYASMDEKIQKKIAPIIAGYADPKEFYVQRLAEGVGTIAAAFYPKPVIVRMSDFKSNEYASLIGGEGFEPKEENPMIGFRGASRYPSEAFAKSFALECEAMKHAREEMGLENISLMIPFVRSVDEAQKVLELMAQQGLARDENELKIFMMCEIPANALLADDFLELFDGFSIGSNDLTQLTLGVDRDSGIVSGFDERDPAVLKLIEMAIKACKAKDKYVGICGQAPSDYPEITEWLVEQGIESISLNPDSVIQMTQVVLDIEEIEQKR